MMSNPLPTFSAENGDGTITNATLKGKVTFINFWETGCAPCMAEMEALNRLSDTLKSNSGFQFVSLTPDEQQGIDVLKRKYKNTYKIYHLDKADCRKFCMGFPTSIIVDKKGNVTYAQSGGSLDNDAIWDYIFGTIYPAILKQLR